MSTEICPCSLWCSGHDISKWCFYVSKIVTIFSLIQFTLFLLEAPDLSSGTKLKCSELWTSGYLRFECTSLRTCLLSSQDGSQVPGWCGHVTCAGIYWGRPRYLSSAVVTLPRWHQARCLCAHWCSGSHQYHMRRYLAFPQDVQWWQGAIASLQDWFRPTALRAVVTQAWWTRFLLFSALKTLSLGFMILTTSHGDWFYHDNHSCRVMVASCLTASNHGGMGVV